MSAESFMEKIYRGFLDRDAFDSYRRAKASERVRALVEKYHDLLKEFPPAELERSERIPPEMIGKMADAGLFGISIPEEYGGLGFDPWEYLKVVEGLAKHDLSAALTYMAHLSIGIRGIELFGTEEQKRKYLAPAASGEMIFSYALTEPRIGSDARHIETRAELSPGGTHYVLNGRKTYITNANYAGGLIVFARMDPARPGFMGAFIVETAWPGVSIGRDMPKMGLKASSTAPIQLKDVAVPVENLLGSPGDGFRIAMTVLNYGRLALGAASMALLELSFEDMVKRSQSRIQFGVPIGTFPLVQEKMVAARAHQFAMTAMNEFTTGLLAAGPVQNMAVETSHCKLFGTTRAWDTICDALQVAGGAGYISTLTYEKRMRDFRVTTIFEGTTEIHSIYPALIALRRLGRELKERRGLERWIYFLKEFMSTFRPFDWPVRFSDETMRRAVLFVKANAKSFRRMLLFGLVLYGNKTAEREFLLRRLTTLSLYSFAVSCLLARLASDQRTGKVSPEDMELLRYFLEEAKEGRKKNRTIFDSPLERIGARIAKGFQK